LGRWFFSFNLFARTADARKTKEKLMPEVRDQILELAVQACKTLFSEYGVEVTPTERADRPKVQMLYCGILGFSGDELRGSVVLAATSQTLLDSNPVTGGSARDWIAELVNQFLGRLKLSLLSRNVIISLATPVVLRGEHLSLEARGPVRPLWFERPNGDTLGLWMDLEAPPGFVLPEPSPDQTPEAGEFTLL
jgi:CheY-specific phosphatase CheX